MTRSMRVISMAMFGLSMVIFIRMFSIQPTPSEGYLVAAEGWLFLTYSLSAVYFLAFIICGLIAHPGDFLMSDGERPSPDAIRFAVIFGFFSAIVLFIGGFVEWRPAHFGEQYQHSAAIKLVPPGLLALLLVLFDVALLGRWPRIWLRPQWERFIRNISKLDVVVLLSIIGVGAYCLFAEVYRVKAGTVQGAQILMFAAGAAMMIMTISNGLFALDMLSHGDDAP